MGDTSISILPDCGTCVNSDSGANAPTLMNLPFEILEQILRFLLPDKDILRASPRCRLEHVTEHEDAANYRGGDFRIWKFDDAFRFDKEPVQTAILRVHRLFYEEGSRILYGRTIEVNIWTRQWHGLYNQRFSSLPLRGFPWAKMRKILISVPSVTYMNYLERIREQLLIFCGFLVSSGLVVRRLHVVYTGEWSPKNTIILPWETHDDSHISSRYTHSEVENLSIMLEPLRQLMRVQECEIQLPASVQDNLRLAGEVQRCITGIQGEDLFDEAELLGDWRRYLLLCKEFLAWEAEDREREERIAVETARYKEFADSQPVTPDDAEIEDDGLTMQSCSDPYW